MNEVYTIKGCVKHYDWGGFFFIPALLKQENPGKKPFAEYWMGTHSLGSADLLLENGSKIKMAEKTGQLPFLLKVLDVKDMLSIQVHPTKKAAEIEFARENAAAIPLDAPHRNYRDDNHKPELMVALSEFWLLHGFKSPTLLTDILENRTEFKELLQVFRQSGYKGLYQYVMELDQEKVNGKLQPLIDRITPLYNSNKLQKNTEDFWAARAALSFSKKGNIDRGIFSIYLFNLVKLQKGEGIFQAAGVPHAYLEGQNVEIMANSDNVLRGGLTTKHIDVKELMKHTRFEAITPEIIKPSVNDHEKVYETPVNDFRLSVFEIKAGQKTKLKSALPEILLITEGEATISSTSNKVSLTPGHVAALIKSGSSVQLEASENALVFRASGRNN